MTKPAQTAKAQTTAPDPTRRLARRVMPFIASDSALLPPDSWIVASIRDSYKTVKPFRRDLQAAGALIGAVAALAVTVVAGLATLAVVGTVTLATVVAGLGVTLAGGAVAALRGRKIWQRAQKETVPAMKEEMGKRYIAYKTEEMMREWKARLEAQRAAKAKAAPVDAPAPSSSPVPTPKLSLRDMFTRKPATPASDTTPPASPPKPR